MNSRAILMLGETLALVLSLAGCAGLPAADAISAAPATQAATRSSIQPTDLVAVREQPDAAAQPVAPPADRSFPVYLTGYSYWSNTPAASAAIARPVIHSHAGGTGSFDDPLTIAVGHSIWGQTQRLDYPAGTRFYFARLRKYAIVEDVCGDGPSPQATGCHVGHAGVPWLDIYVGGEGASASAAYACASKITSVQAAIRNPPRGLPVDVGPLTETGCRTFAPAVPAPAVRVALAG